MSLLTHRLAWWVRETSPPYGAPPESSPADLAKELVEAWHALARAESAVALAEGDTLRLVADQRLHLRLGFSSFHDFCVEAAEMTASSGKRRVAVSRLAADVPALRDALLDGTVSQCQALALRPIITRESAAWWIAVAARSTVTQLRAAVRQGSESAEGSSEGTSSAAKDASEEEPEGRRISIAAPVAARLAFEEGLELARKTLGYQAPRHACIAAMLAEVAGHGLTSEPVSSNHPRPAEGVGRDEGELGRSSQIRGEAELGRAPRIGGESEVGCAGHSGDRAEHGQAPHIGGEVELDSEPADPRQRRLQRLCRSQHEVRPFMTSRDSTSEPDSTAASAGATTNGATAGPDSTRNSGEANFPSESDSGSGSDSAPGSDSGWVSDSGLGSDSRSESDSGSESNSWSKSDSAPGSDSELRSGLASKTVPAFLRASMKQARQTINDVYEQLDSFRELLEEAPTEADADDPASIVERLEEIRALSAPIHVLSLRVLFHLEDVSAARYLGVRTQDALAETHLRLSPRTFRQLTAEAWQMKRRPELGTAYLSGNIGVSRLRLLGSIESRRLKKFLARARRITLRQLKRELRFHEKLLVLRDQLQRERSAQERFAERHEDVARGVRPGPNHDCRDRPPVLVLSERDCDPLPGNDLDAKLACILLQHG